MSKLRRDFEVVKRFNGDERPRERLVAHYLLERRLSDRLRDASRDERSKLYTSLYSALFEALPDHPQHRTHNLVSERIDSQLISINRYLNQSVIFLEIGCGDATLAFAASKRAEAVYGLDVTDALVELSNAPSNFTFVGTSGIEIP